MALSVFIPGWGTLQLQNILFDLNGTLACDGHMAESTRTRLHALAAHLTLYVMTADTYGTVEQTMAGLPIQAQRLRQEVGAAEKQAFLNTLGAQQTAAIGNGRNDVLRLTDAALSMANTGPEGAAQEAIQAADIVFCHIDDALDALLNPKRLVATLRG